MLVTVEVIREGAFNLLSDIDYESYQNALREGRSEWRQALKTPMFPSLGDLRASTREILTPL